MHPTVEVSAGAQPARPDLAAIFDEQFGYVWSTLRRLGVREAEIEDLSHDVFLRVHARLADCDPTRPIRPWPFGFAYRLASDYRRLAMRSSCCSAPAPFVFDFDVVLVGAAHAGMHLPVGRVHDHTESRRFDIRHAAGRGQSRRELGVRFRRIGSGRSRHGGRRGSVARGECLLGFDLFTGRREPLVRSAQVRQSRPQNGGDEWRPGCGPCAGSGGEIAKQGADDDKQAFDDTDE